MRAGVSTQIVSLCCVGLGNFRLAPCIANTLPEVDDTARVTS